MMHSILLGPIESVELKRILNAFHQTQVLATSTTSKIVYYDVINYGPDESLCERHEPSDYFLHTRYEERIDLSLKEVTVNANLSNKGNIYDFDPSRSTYAVNATFTLPAGTSVEAIKWDLGAVNNIILFFKHYQYHPTVILYSKIQVSSDGATWTDISSVKNTTAEDVVKTSCRYIRWLWVNADSVNASLDPTNYCFRLYKLEVYPQTLMTNVKVVVHDYANVAKSVNRVVLNPNAITVNSYIYKVKVI